MAVKYYNVKYDREHGGLHAGFAPAYSTIWLAVNKLTNKVLIRVESSNTTHFDQFEAYYGSDAQPNPTGVLPVAVENWEVLVGEQRPGGPAQSDGNRALLRYDSLLAEIAQWNTERNTVHPPYTLLTRVTP
jgi:hypothetical protein